MSAPPSPRAPLRSLNVALSFLTRLPVADPSPVDDEDLRQATAWFPVVGAVVGCFAGLARWSLEAPLGPTTASILAVAVAALTTGAFHEDGLADTFDGMWGGWTPERRIEIMRDSRLGTYGALALLVAVLLQVALLAELGAATAGATLVLAHTVGRLAILVQIRTSRPATDQGSGATVAEPIATPVFVAALAFSLSVLVVGMAIATASDAGAAWGVAGALIAMLLVVRTLGGVAMRRLGGTTGDVLGATALTTIVTTMAVVVTVTRLLSA